MAQIRIPSPITGTVWKIVVKPGDAVGSDEPLIIFESSEDGDPPGRAQIRPRHSNSRQRR